MEQQKYRLVQPGSLNRDPIYTRLLAHHFGMGIGLGMSNETATPFTSCESIPLESAESCRSYPERSTDTEPIAADPVHSAGQQRECIAPRPYPVLPAVTAIVTGVLVGHGIKCLLEWLRER